MNIESQQNRGPQGSPSVRDGETLAIQQQTDEDQPNRSPRSSPTLTDGDAMALQQQTDKSQQKRRPQGSPSNSDGEAMALQQQTDEDQQNRSPRGSPAITDEGAFQQQTDEDQQNRSPHGSLIISNGDAMIHQQQTDDDQQTRTRPRGNVEFSALLVVILCYVHAYIVTYVSGWRIPVQNLLIFISLLVNFHIHTELNLTSKPAIRDLMNIVAAKTPNKWMEFGLQLGIDTNQLNAFERQRGGVTNSIYADIFSAWEKRQGDMPFTWSTVIGVLKSPSVGENALAQTVQEFITKSHDLSVEENTLYQNIQECITR